ncbi:MAG: lipoyl synthase, partial [Gammaproteobacteria bacterium]
MPEPTLNPVKPVIAGDKLRGAEKMARIPVKIEPTLTPLRKPAWIRAKSTATPEVARIKQALRANKLHTVCEEANCPNL